MIIASFDYVAKYDEYNEFRKPKKDNHKINTTTMQRERSYKKLSALWE